MRVTSTSSRVQDNFKMSSLGNEVTLTISLIELDVKIIFGLGDRVVETILFFN